MQSMGRKLAFVLASSNHGTMIVNRLDYHMVESQGGFGVGFQILETASFDPSEVRLAVDLLGLRRKHHGDGVVAIDCGANIGVHAIAVHGAVSSESGILEIPNPNYLVPSSFGSLELRQRNGNEFIGQPID